MKNKLVLTVFCLLLPAPALAYIDPGAGSALAQGLVGLVASLLFIMRLYWHRFLCLLGIRKKTVITDENTPAGEAE